MADKGVYDLTTGPPARGMLAFAVPLMLGGLLQQLFAVVDAVVVGQGVGIEALAAVGSTDWINWLFLWMVQGLSQGFGVHIAQRYGAGDYGAMRRAIAMSALMGLCIGVLLTVAGLLSARPLLGLLQTPANIRQGAWTYLRILFSGMLAVTAYNLSSAILRSLGDSRSPLIAMGIAAVVNVALDLVFVFAFGWGIAGVAIATVLAQLGAFCYCLAAIRHREQVRLERADWRPDTALMARLLRLGLPLACSEGIIAIGGMFVQYVVNGMGFLTVAGFTATNKVYGILESTAISLGFAVTTFVAQNYGAGQLLRIRRGVRNMFFVSTGASLCIALFMALFGRRLLWLFVDGSSASAADVVDTGYRYLFIMSCLLFFLYYIFVFRSALQGLGKARVSLFAAGMEFCMRAGVAVLALALATEGLIFFAEVSAWIGASLLLIPVYGVVIRKISRAGEG